jgi:hypothetical protein
MALSLAENYCFVKAKIIIRYARMVTTGGIPVKIPEQPKKRIACEIPNSPKEMAIKRASLFLLRLKARNPKTKITRHSKKFIM